MAIELNDGRIFTGRTSPLMGACANATMNALKALAGIEDERHLLSPEVIEPIQKLKGEASGKPEPPPAHRGDAAGAVRLRRQRPPGHRPRWTS